MTERLITATLTAAALTAAALTAAALAVPPATATGQAVEPSTEIVVAARDVRTAVSPLLNGANLRWNDNGDGLWQPDLGRPDPVATAKTAQAGVNLIRYPGGTVANLFDWKRAIGPQAERRCQLNGRPDPGTPVDSVYGPDEHMRLVAESGAEAEIMVPFANETPADAADWVEYMNAALGSNPRGGVAWADVRAANGHREPYGVKLWEIGNEHDRPAGQRYWMMRGSENDATAMRQYAFGGVQRQVDQRTGKGCNFSEQLTSDASPNQVFSVWFPPVVPGSQVVYVAGTAWTAVPDLSSAGPADRVYQFDPGTGAIRFGDGAHGAIPPKGAKVTADYDSGPHAGFVDFYREMKRADPSIDVCAIWARPEFPKLMAETGHAGDYDCLAMHPYLNLGETFDNVWESNREGHDQTFIGEVPVWDDVVAVNKSLRRHAPRDTYLAASELGALFFGGAWTPEGSETNMSHALYNISQIARLADLGAGWVLANTLSVPSGLRSVIGQPGNIYTAEAVAREAMKPLVEGGGRLVANEVRDNPIVLAEQATDIGSTYDALVVTTAKGADGNLNVLVVNRHPTDAVEAKVVPAGFVHDRQVRVTQVAPDSYADFNSAAHLNDVAVERSTVPVGDNAFGYRFPAHSVTVLELDAETHEGRTG